ncbi:hypothetical protein [Anaerococcus sp.]|uniref:hypothetical protein n=1 Tax=Anaerococcus sp. TaxID=1872515 RepID=UPI0025848D54|nr:hypothetical protein [Anaerococcus sp.]MDU3210708.1 hypothetical protein [Anaerococcus sp.]
MNINNQIYWQIYQQIEDEVLELSKSIHFVDDHLEVYSIKIADLIIRTSIEVESISKEIARVSSDNLINSAGEAINWLESNWNISDKILKIYSDYFNFSDEINVFKPFNYSRNDKNDYYSVYNAVKHDRNKNLYKANIYSLIRVLGALFILNIYYNNETINLKQDYRAENLDKSNGSKIFNYEIYPYDKIISLSDNKVSKEMCLYEILKQESEYSVVIEYMNVYGEVDFTNITSSNAYFQQQLEKLDNVYLEIEDMIKILSCISLNFEEDFNKNMYGTLKAKEILSARVFKFEADYYGVLIK